MARPRILGRRGETRPHPRLDNSSADEFVASGIRIVCRRWWKSATLWKGGRIQRRRRVEIAVRRRGRGRGGPREKSAGDFYCRTPPRRSLGHRYNWRSRARRITRTITRTKKWHRAGEDNAEEGKGEGGEDPVEVRGGCVERRAPTTLPFRPFARS
jgi:hypothetical protein